jgi:heat shock protein HslJ
MSDDDLRLRLIEAAEGFPIQNHPADLSQRVVRRRRVIAARAIAAAAVVVAGIGVIVPMARAHDRQPVVASSPCPVGKSLAGSMWRLVSVADTSGTTQIPPENGARLQLSKDGQIGFDDGVNFHSGRFTVSGSQLVVEGGSSTLVAYAGHDPARIAPQMAAMVLMDGMADGRSHIPARSTVIEACDTRLVLQAGPARLTFEWSGVFTGLPSTR